MTAERPRLAVDLFAGTGGATAAFLDAGWDVIRVDANPRAAGFTTRTAANICADVRARHFWWGPSDRRPDLLWASPPCTEFSDANPHRPARPSLELVHAVLEAVADLKPRFWVLENVRGAIPYLGIPAQKVGPWCLWGYFPPIRATFTAQTHRKSDVHTAVARGAVPYALSRALLEAVELYRDVPSLLDLRPFRRHRHRADPRRRTADATLL